MCSLCAACCLKPVISTAVDRMFCTNHLPHSPDLPVVKVLQARFIDILNVQAVGFFYLKIQHSISSNSQILFSTKIF